MRHFGKFALIALLAATAAAPARAQVSNTKATTMVIGFGPGGGYDLWGRTVARFIGKHMPGAPRVVAQNLPGAVNTGTANPFAAGNANAPFSQSPLQ